MTMLTNTLESDSDWIKIPRKDLENLQHQVAYLQEQLEWFKRQIFGQKSEKILVKDPCSEELFFPGIETRSAIEQAEKEIQAHTRIIKKDKSNKLTFPDDLPVVQSFIDLKDEEKICSETGKPLVKIGEDISQKLAYKPGQYYIKETIRSKYAAIKDGESLVLSPELPESFLPKCKADESFLADILVKKFADHLPLYRQVEILSREGINASRQLLSQWVVKSGLALKPLYDEMRRFILKSNNLFIDEVPVDMMSPGKGTVQQTYMWVMVGGRESNPGYRIYHFKPDRRHAHAEELLRNYQGFVHSDKYGAYEALASKKYFIWCPCWAHIRRKFFEAEGGDPKFRKEVLRKIKYLFMLERVAWKRSEEERLRIREEKEIPIIDDLIDLIKNRLIHGKTLAKSKFKEALGYFCSLIPYLKNYTKSSYARLDNNVAERAVRPLAIGRKNWLFLGSEEGGEAAGIILSLVQTCRALNINPRDYLEDIMRRLMSYNQQNLSELLPDQWIKAKSLPV